MRRYVQTLSRALGFLGFFSATAGSLSAQSTSVISFPTINASQAADGLGFQVNGDQDWQFAAIAAAGGTHVRLSCPWASVEQQSAPPYNRQASPAYVLNSSCVNSYASAKKYGLHPTVIASYGAPFHQILTVTMPQGAAAGAKSIQVQFSAGAGGDTLANVKFPYDYICPLAPGTSVNGANGRCTGAISNRYSAPGTLITGVTLNDATHATLTLASALRAALPADSTQYMVDEILYPSTASQDPNDPSVVAFSNYVQFLADDMASRGLTGDIEIWNEPPWANDAWDFRPYLYDPGTYTGPSLAGANFGFAANIMHRTFPAGVTATWNGTSGNGLYSLLGGNMQAQTGQKLVQPSTTLTKESFHPYGGGYGIPEYMLMDPNCLEAAAKSSDIWGKNIFGNGRDCYLPGVPKEANLMQAVELDDIAKLVSPSYGIGHSVTETNNVGPVAGMQTLQLRSNMRQFLSYQAMGITPIEFFEVWNGVNGSDPSYSFVDFDGTTFVPRIGHTALAGLMSNIRSIASAPATTYSASTLPSVSSYSGTYPLMSFNMVGSRSGVSANSAAFYVWQLSSCGSGRGCWFNITTAPGKATVQIPAAMKVTSVRDTVTLTNVAYTTNGQQISFPVSDNPIEILADPSDYVASADQNLLQPTRLALTPNPSTSSFGAQVALTATLSPYSTKTKTTNGQAISFYDGNNLLATVPLISGVATFDTTSFGVGTHNLRAAYAGDSNFSSSTTGAVLSVISAKTQLSVQPIADQVYGTPSVQVHVSSSSPGQITYAVVSGAARFGTASASGATLALTGAGQVVIQVKQQATASYVAQTAQITFTVKPATPTVTFPQVATQTYGGRTVYLTAGSASKAPFTYSVVSGPATLSGSALTITGAGVVTVKAAQPAAGNYNAASATQSFTVLPLAPTMQIGLIRTQTFGWAPTTVSATSTSPGAITYSVVSGPASVAGSSVSLLGAGTVVVQANQAATANYKASSIQTSFVILPGSPNLGLNQLPTVNFGVAPLLLQPKSLSPAPITFKVTMGPAHISGNSVVLDGAGFIVVQAVQAASANYVGATAQTAFRAN